MNKHFRKRFSAYEEIPNTCSKWFERTVWHYRTYRVHKMSQNLLLKFAVKTVKTNKTKAHIIKQLKIQILFIRYNLISISNV